MRLGLISAAYPPDLDGIGDYTWWMARTLAEREDVKAPVVVFTRVGDNHKQSAGVEISRFFDFNRPETFSRLRSIVESGYNNPEQRLAWLVLQYNPFSWGRRGYCPRVPSTLHRLREGCSRIRLAVMFHETTVPKWPWRFLLMFTWQYPIFRKVCRTADVAFISTARWTPHIRRTAPSLPIHHLPVGSNIPLCNVSRNAARMELGIDPDTLVLGVFGSAHISRQLDWIAATFVEAKRRHPWRRTMLLYVGPEGSAMRHALGDAEMVDCGALPAEEVGNRLLAMDAAISPFLDGISTRRGSVMALLQHGIPVATTQLSWTDELFRTALPTGMLVSSAASAKTFAEEAVTWIDHLPSGGVPDPGAKRFFERNFSWHGIADTMMRHLC